MNEGPTLIAGAWRSEYPYPSTGRGGTFTSQHDVDLRWEGSRLAVRSLPSSPSLLTMELAIEGQVVTGTWREATDPDGYYRGREFHGAVQFLLDPGGRQMAGKWVGYGTDEVNTGDWSLTLTGNAETP